MLGDTDPKQLGEAVVPGPSRDHVLEQEYLRASFFQRHPAEVDPRPLFPDVKWIQLKGSQLWVSYGEMTSLADWLPPYFDTLSRKVVLPGLQRMREDTCLKINKFRLSGRLSEAYIEALSPKFEGAASIGGSTGWLYRKAGVESDKAVDASTAKLGTDRYLSLVARNACHFAPFSWHRWAAFHQDARTFAQAYHDGATAARPVKDIDTGMDENLRQAWLHNGYGDHFLQDSFAAGHLINKMLVMQWFVDYVNELASPWWDFLGGFLIDATKPWYGMPDDFVMESMGTAQQPEMSGRHLYGSPGGEPGLSEEWAAGFAPTDPQTAQERRTREQMIAGSGVRGYKGHPPELTYGAYLEFLNSTFLSLAAGNTHDYFNHRGLYVRNEQGDVMKVGGDNSLIELSLPLGAERAAEATVLSRRAISEILDKGTTDVTVDAIWRLVPTSVYAAPWQDWWEKSMFPARFVEARFYGLEEWHDKVLHDTCVHEIFPDVVDSVSSKAVRALSPELSEVFYERLNDIRSPTLPAPPVPQNIGDFVIPGSRAGRPT